VSTTTTCRIGGPASDLDKRAMHECLIKYRNGTILFLPNAGKHTLITDSPFFVGNWNGMGCGGRGWFKGGRSWDNPDNCYDGCASCISEAINRGANDVQCDQTVGFAACWMGYH